ncbi:MAG: hypothetical protein AAGJ51_08175 [Pseudomonadota bacterium]
MKHVKYYTDFTQVLPNYISSQSSNFTSVSDPVHFLDNRECISGFLQFDRRAQT